MAAESIGRCRCPLCESKRARLTLSRNSLPVLTCSDCRIQLFARGDESDELLRARLVPDEPAPAPVRTEKAPPAPVRRAVPPPEPAPEPVRAAPAPAPVQAPRPFWGLGGT